MPKSCITTALVCHTHGPHAAALFCWHDCCCDHRATLMQLERGHRTATALLLLLLLLLL
jgi:hypothetical protein